MILFTPGFQGHTVPGIAEFAGLENDGLENDGQEKDGLENDRLEKWRSRTRANVYTAHDEVNAN